MAKPPALPWDSQSLTNIRKPPDSVNRSKLTDRRFSMELLQSLKHTKWDCKYHIVWIPKYRRKVLYGELRKYLGEVLRGLAQQKESTVWKGHLMPDCGLSLIRGLLLCHNSPLPFHAKSPSFVYLCWLLVILLDLLNCTPASIPRRRLDLLLNATWYETLLNALFCYFCRLFANQKK